MVCGSLYNILYIYSVTWWIWQIYRSLYSLQVFLFTLYTVPWLGWTPFVPFVSSAQSSVGFSLIWDRSSRASAEERDGEEHPTPALSASKTPGSLRWRMELVRQTGTHLSELGRSRGRNLCPPWNSKDIPAALTKQKQHQMYQRGRLNCRDNAVILGRKKRTTGQTFEAKKHNLTFWFFPRSLRSNIETNIPPGCQQQHNTDQERGLEGERNQEERLMFYILMSYVTKQSSSYRDE